MTTASSCPRARFPVLSFVLAPMVALALPTREPRGELVCGDRAVLAGEHRAPEPVALTGALEGAPPIAGTLIGRDEFLLVSLPRHHGAVQVRIRADHDDAYRVEARAGTEWTEVGRFGPARGEGMQNRPALDARVGPADTIALSPLSGGEPFAVSMVCARGSLSPLPVWLIALFAAGVVFVIARSIPHPGAAAVLRSWGEADPWMALGFGLLVLDDAAHAAAFGLACVLAYGWRRRAALRLRSGPGRER